jgi:hypothetical protein
MILGWVEVKKLDLHQNNGLLVIRASRVRYPCAVLDGLKIKQKEHHGYVRV